MSRVSALAAAVVVALPLASRQGSSQAVFEGGVTFKMTMEGQSMETKYYSNGKRARSEMGLGGRQMITIIDYAEAKSYTLLPEQKKYMMMDLNAMAEMAKGMSEAMGGDKNPKNPKNPDLSKLPKITVTATGQKETIAGYACEHYTVQSEKTDMDFCVAKGLGNYSMPGGGGMGGMGGGGMLAALAANPGYKQLIDMAKEGFFPLKFTVSEGGKVKMTSEATEITRGGVSPELFAIPSGYTEIRMPGFGPKKP